MNPIIIEYFDTCEVKLIESPAIVSYQILRREIAAVDGKLRIKAALIDEGSLDAFFVISEIEKALNRIGLTK